MKHTCHAHDLLNPQWSEFTSQLLKFHEFYYKPTEKNSFRIIK